MGLFESIAGGAAIASNPAVALGTAGLASNAWQGYKNFSLQKRNYEYQRGVQARTWQREDTAVQRRVADLRAAGLSPTLAAGSAAASGPVVSTQAPQMDYPSMSDEALKVLAMIRGDADISRTREDTVLTQLNQVKAIAETQKLDADTQKAVADMIHSYASTRQLNVNIVKLLHDLKIAQDSGARTNASGITGNAVDIGAILRNFFHGTGRSNDPKNPWPKPRKNPGATGKW